MANLPVIVGFGGVNAAGRSSCHHGYRRMIIDKLSHKDALETYLGLATMMGILRFENGVYFDQAGQACSEAEVVARFGEEICKKTLIRRIEQNRFDAEQIPVNKSMNFQSVDDQDIVIKVTKRQLPNVIPENWEVTPLDEKDRNFQVKIKEGIKVLVPDTRKSLVQAAGQIPAGFDPGKLYTSVNHPQALKLTVYGASDAIGSMGINWEDVMARVNPDQVGVYASSALGQMDDEGAGGYSKAGINGKRPSTKQLAFSLAEMPADFINAYILGSVGHTTGIAAACATFLYNLYAAIQDIQTGQRRVAIVGASEGAVLPEVIEAFRVMGALAEDDQLFALDKAKGLSEVDYSRACRPFAPNCGFVVGESAQFAMLFDDTLAMELGAEVYGSVGSVFVNADGYKKSISQPGVGNYATLAKALASGRQILGEDSLRSKTFISAHGSGTPQNRETESHVLNELAKAFGITSWPVTAVKAYVGHSTGPASGDQLAAALGTWKYGWVPGIFSMDEIPEDVHNSNLRLEKEHMEFGSEGIDAALLNSKGFGGNNSSGLILSPHVTKRMLEKKHGSNAMVKYTNFNESVREKINEYDQKMIQGGVEPIYCFGKGVLERDSLEITDSYIKIDGFKNKIDLNLDNPYSDMV